MAAIILMLVLAYLWHPVVLDDKPQITHEIIPTYYVDHVTPGSLHVKCQETKHEIIPTYSVDHVTPGSLHVKCQETIFNLI